MKKFSILLLLCTVVSIMYCCSNAEKPSVEVEKKYTDQVHAFAKTIEAFNALLNQQSNSTQKLQASFFQMREAYKKIEIFVDYYNPGTAKALNGPALFEAEAENPVKPEAPSGFQVLEEMIFPTYDSANLPDIKVQASILQSIATRLVANATTTKFTDAHIFDALRSTIVRLETLGISGFDSPIANQSVEEAKATLTGLQDYIDVFIPNEKPAYQQLIKMATSFLNQQIGFNEFDRAAFIVDYLNPLSTLLFTTQTRMGIPFFNEPRPLRANTKTIFDTAAFDPWFYSPQQKNTTNKYIVRLGEKLFFDNIISLNGTRNCGSCHNPALAFTDGLTKNKSFDGKKTISRNTPSILYAAMQPVQFADSRLVYLEDQAKQVIENPNEMHGNLPNASKALAKSSIYNNLFKQAFDTDGINPEKIQQAIAAYIRSKTIFNSSFDAYMRGDKKAMTEEQIQGFNLFMGKAKCGTCHFMPLFNGVVPPFYLQMESEVLGVPASNKPPYTVDTDSGKFALYNAPLHLYSFKTPTVRNAARTAPYMHNGVFNNLEALMDFYTKGGGAGLGIQLPNQTLPPDALGLNKNEIKAIISFMQALNDK